MPELKPGEKILIPPEIVQKVVDRIGLTVAIRALMKEKEEQKAVSNN